METTPDTLLYVITTICTFALGIGIGAHIENRRIKKTDIENLIKKNMFSNIYLYENLNIHITINSAEYDVATAVTQRIHKTERVQHESRDNNSRASIQNRNTRRRE